MRLPQQHPGVTRLTLCNAGTARSENRHGCRLRLETNPSVDVLANRPKTKNNKRLRRFPLGTNSPRTVFISRLAARNGRYVFMLARPHQNAVTVAFCQQARNSSHNNRALPLAPMLLFGCQMLDFVMAGETLAGADLSPVYFGGRETQSLVPDD
jgi:hypothetical protein